MRKKAIILDLDNTIYPVSSIGEKLFKSLLILIKESGEHDDNFEEIKDLIMRRPFQFVANDFSFSEQLKTKSMELLSELTYDDVMIPFDGYETLADIPCKKYLVTTGFIKMQNSKIRQLKIENDFDKIFIVDPSKSTLTKKDVFAQILLDNQYKPEDVLVVGDDLHSEIKAAKMLGIDTVVYNYNGTQPATADQKAIQSFKEILPYLG